MTCTQASGPVSRRQTRAWDVVLRGLAILVSLAQIGLLVCHVAGWPLVR